MYTETAEQGRSTEVQALAEQLYRERYRYLLGIAVNNAATFADAEEAVQEAFAAFIRHFDPDRGAPPLAWLTLTVKRECWAKGHRSLELSAFQDAKGHSQKCELPQQQFLERAEHVLEARQCLSQLKSAERLTLLLIGAGYSYAEVSEMNDWTLRKVTRCAAEGRAALREMAAA